MTKEETIKVLQSIEDRAVDFPYMTACDWVAIAAAKRHLTEEPVSEDLEEALAREWQGYNDRGAATVDALEDNTQELAFAKGFYRGAQWQKEHLWKPADGNDLPEIDKEVIVLLSNGMVAFGHRPPEYWVGKNIDSGKVTRNYVKRYDKGQWNQPNIKYWLDLNIPNLEEN